MRAWNIAAVVFGVGLLVACDEEPSTSARGSQRGAGGSETSGQQPAAGPTGPSCPAGIAAPTSLGTDADASDVRIVGSAVYFRSGTKLVRVNKDGSGRTDVFTSKSLIRAYTDGTTLLTIESPDPPNAVVRIGALGAKPEDARQIDTDFDALSANIFGADATNLYAVGETENGDNIYRFGKQEGGADVIAETKGVVSSPQIANGAVWYVREQTEIYKVALSGGEPTLVATVSAGCSLAVGAKSLYCATAGALEERDLTGASAKTLYSEKTSSVPVGFGAPLASGDSVISASSAVSALGGVVRSITGGTERVVACGRAAIGSIALDASSVAWAEAGKGVFLAPAR